ncbi:hypothetical protein SAMN02745229_01776 [Butyrivibrio fibrisolvens DSM 3071]|uniref:Uncharacterized protein n=1 Tax=Butyrivibrio fibrisolvens DSM 3071 TaxID=1121131 RepID=A0A1M5YVP5_BUTFI|nr:hypothetical protein [Butyrivibrio fibrisolvens]SHI16146.1 hypothetical protein SAMN02745229_01776 [Butyrivibrio fibrisolvens DSM 3071]
MVYKNDSKVKINNGKYKYGLEGVKTKMPLFPKLMDVDISATEYSNKRIMTISNGCLLKLRFDLYEYEDTVDIVRRQGIFIKLIKIILFMMFLILGLYLVESADTFFQTEYKFFLLYTFLFCLLIYAFLYNCEYQRLVAVFYTRDSDVKNYIELDEERKDVFKNRLLDSMRIEEVDLEEEDDDISEEKEIKDLSEDGLPVADTSLSKRKIIYRIGIILSLLTALYVVVCIIIARQKGLSKPFILALGLSSLPLFVYSLIFKNDVKYIDKKHTEDDSRFNMFGLPFLILDVSFLILMFTSGITKIAKGGLMIAIIYIIVAAFLLLIVFIRFHDVNNKNQKFCYMFFVAMLTFNIVSSFFYGTSSFVGHFPCEYVSRSYSSGKTTSYYVTVELQDGSIYKCRVSKDIYDSAETEELVSCHSDGYLGVKYISVHCAD